MRKFIIGKHLLSIVFLLVFAGCASEPAKRQGPVGRPPSPTDDPFFPGRRSGEIEKKQKAKPKKTKTQSKEGLAEDKSEPSSVKKPDPDIPKEAPKPESPSLAESKQRRQAEASTEQRDPQTPETDAPDTAESVTRRSSPGLSLKATRQSVQSALTSATRARNITNQLSNISSKPPEKAKQKHSSVPNPSTKAARLSASHAFASTTRAKRLAEDLAGESASRRAIDAKRSKRRPTDKTSSSQVTPSMETTRVSMNHAFTSTIRARQLAERIDEKSTAADKNTSAGAKPSPPNKEHLSQANKRIQTARASMSHALTSTNRARQLARQISEESTSTDKASPTRTNRRPLDQRESPSANSRVQTARASMSHALTSTNRARQLARQISEESTSTDKASPARTNRRPLDERESPPANSRVQTARLSISRAFASTFRAKRLAENIAEESTSASGPASTHARTRRFVKQNSSRANLRVQTARTSMSHAFTSTSRAKKLAEQVASASDSASPSPQQAVESTNDSSKRSLDEQTKSKSPRKRPFCYSCVQLCTKQEESESCNSANRKVVCGWGRRSQKKTAKSVARRYCNQHLQSLSSENSPWRTVLGDCPRASCQLRE